MELGLPKIGQRIARSVEFRYDRLTASARNDRLDAKYLADRDFHLRRIDAAVSAAAGWFEPQRDVSMSVLYCALGTLRRTGDPRLNFVERQMEHYRNSVRDPAFRVLDRTYDDADPAYADLPDIMDVRPYFPVELMMIDAAWADVRGADTIIEKLKSFSDGAGYGSTHVVIGGLIVLENGAAAPDAVWPLIRAEVDAIALCNDQTARAEDLFAERCMVLQWMGEAGRVRPAWVLRLLDRQRADGGWSGRNIPPLGQSNQHTSVLALAVLTYFLAQERGQLLADPVLGALPG